METSMKKTIWMVAISKVVCAMGATVLETIDMGTIDMETIVKTIVTVANTVLDSRCMMTDRTHVHS